jgi:hypothetical protein
MDPRQLQFTLDSRWREVRGSSELEHASESGHENSPRLHVEQEGLAVALTTGTRRWKVLMGAFYRLGSAGGDPSGEVNGGR